MELLIIACFWVFVMAYTAKSFAKLNNKQRELIREKSNMEWEPEHERMLNMESDFIHNYKPAQKEDLPYKVDDLDSILETIVRIKESSDDLKPYMEDYCVMLKRLNELKGKTDYLMKNCYNPELFGEVNAKFESVQDSTIQNAKDIIMVCVSSLEDEEFHPSEPDLKTIGQECMSTRDLITKYESLLSTATKLSIQTDREGHTLEIDSLNKALNQMALLKGR